MGTTAHGITYPDASGVPSRSALESVAESVESSVWGGLARPVMYAAGNVTVTTDSGGQATISFGRTFPTPPVVVAMGGNGESITMGYTTGRLTQTGFTVYFYNQAGTALVNTGVRCLWQAFLAT